MHGFDKSCKHKPSYGKNDPKAPSDLKTSRVRRRSISFATCFFGHLARDLLFFQTLGGYFPFSYHLGNYFDEGQMMGLYNVSQAQFINISLALVGNQTTFGGEPLES